MLPLNNKSWVGKVGFTHTTSIFRNASEHMFLEKVGHHGATQGACDGMHDMHQCITTN